jgi:hypothetical protein
MRRSLALVAAAALLLAGCTSDPEPEPRPAPTTSFQLPGRSGGATVFGAHWDWNRYEQFEPYLRKLAGSSTYHELSWCDVEKTQGSPDWTALDRIADRTRALGISLDLKIRTGVCWATGGTAQFTRGQANKTESALPENMAAYQAFVTALVQRYRPYGVTQYAIENEVNAQQYWAGTPEQYEELVRAAAAAITKADPAARVADSGISSVAMGMGIADRLLKAGQADAAVAAYRSYFARRTGTRGKQIPEVADEAGLRAALAHPTNVRNLAYLAVTERLLDDKVVAVRQLHFYEHPDGITPLLDYLTAETPAGVPVEAWEVGRFDKSADADPVLVADEMTKVASRLAAGGVTEIVWLPLAYNPGNRAGAEVRYGLLDPDGTERQAGTMLAGLAAAARGATASPVSQDGLDGVAFSGRQGTRMVVWSASAPVDVQLPVRPLAGSAAPTEVSATPVLVESDQPLDKALDALRG